MEEHQLCSGTERMLTQKNEICLQNHIIIKQNIMTHINIICFEVISFHGFKIVYTNKINSFHIGT